MALDALIDPVLAFVREHRMWAAPIVAGATFAGSLAVLAMVVPAAVTLVGIGALLGAAGIGLGEVEFWTICLAGALGGVAGGWLSYEVGRWFKGRAKRVWPLRRYPDLVARAEDFVHRYGVWSVFFGRFLGPLRAFVPLVAGVFDMPRFRFQVANVTSALVWPFGLLAPGAGLFGWLGG